MRVGGRVVGAIVIVVALLVVAFVAYHTHELERQRNQTVEQLLSLPQYEHCIYDDASLCPQAQENVVVPNLTGILLVVLVILLGVHLFRADRTSKGILTELKGRKTEISRVERRKVLFSVLTPDERKIVEAVLAQPGISQATLRLRADCSKAKLSMLLKGLEARNVLVRDADGKTNTVHCKEDW